MSPAASRFELKAASGPLTGKTFTLSERTAIGSADQAEIVVEGIEPEHARLNFDGERLTLTCRAETFVNGQLAHERVLQSGDEIRLGVHRFVLRAPGLRPESVLRQPTARGISPWTWVLIGTLAALGVGGFATLLIIGTGG